MSAAAGGRLERVAVALACCAYTGHVASVAVRARRHRASGRPARRSAENHVMSSGVGVSGHRERACRVARVHEQHPVVRPERPDAAQPLHALRSRVGDDEHAQAARADRDARLAEARRTARPPGSSPRSRRSARRRSRPNGCRHDDDRRCRRADTATTTRRRDAAPALDTDALLRELGLGRAARRRGRAPRPSDRSCGTSRRSTGTCRRARRRRTARSHSVGVASRTPRTRARTSARR